MARIEIDPNYSSPTFSRATAPTDIFKKEDVQNVAAALSTHVHDGAGRGLSVVPGSGSIPGSALADGSITSAKITDGTIVSADIGTGAITTANIAAQAITRVVYDQVATTDLWSNAGVGTTGDTNLPGYPVLVTVDPDAQYYIVEFQISVYWNAPIAGAVVGFDMNYQNTQYAKLHRVFIPGSPPNAIQLSHTGLAIIPSVGSASVQVGPYFYTNTAIASGLNLLAASNGQAQYLRLTVLEVRR